MGSFLNKGLIINTDCHARLKYIRKQLGYTQEEMAAKVGVSQGAIQKLEAGDRKLSLDQAEAICLRVPDIDFIWLVSGYERTEKKK
jgi:transcriptional regulator with XRE-family HTH domain